MSKRKGNDKRPGNTGTSGISSGFSSVTGTVTNVAKDPFGSVADLGKGVSNLGKGMLGVKTNQEAVTLITVTGIV